MFFARPVAALALMGLLACAGFSANDANAQQIYRIVAPDGRVTFSDKPPTEGNLRASAAPMVQLPPDPSAASLPFELRQVANRYPVTLYTAPGCAPCGAGRAMLASRGVPFAERTVTTNEDIDALKRLAGAPSLPFLTIGGQQIKGFSEIEWVQFLDAAGYPKTSQLPPGYTPSPATPLVTAQEPQRATARAPVQSEPPAAPPAPAAPADNPAGIRF